ncbi:hypothetical protein WJX73_008061 [Symbiochloris irregularis]|uniref:Protein kinase domain-containing protein n=1 Tax=Symbiochloris irregularis TaxID=706552 RepID=A0AAW1PRX0_9CHLO
MERSKPTTKVPAPRREPLEFNLKYRKVRDIAAGTFGFVQQAKEVGKEHYVAIKFIKRGNNITKYVGREIVNHSQLLHPHVVRFHEVFLTEEYLAIVMEYMDGGDMFAYVKRRRGLEEDEARWYFQQVVCALQYIHESGVIIRDIKLENTLLDSTRRPQAKLCDFGYSKSDKDSLPKSKVGTPGYTAPEVMFNFRSYNGALADVWSSGVMLYVMMFCSYPFGAPNEFPTEQTETKLAEYREQARQGLCSFPDQVPVSSEFRDLIRRMLNPDPDQRATIAEVLQHPWTRKDMPEDVLDMNASCLQLKGQTAGSQTPEEIQALVMEAMNIPRERRKFYTDIVDSQEELW